MAPYGYGQYGGLPDPYEVPEGAGPVDLYEAMLNGQTAVAALDAAEHPQYQYVLDPVTGQPIFRHDGTPLVERIPMEQRMVPVVRRQMVRRLKMRLAMLVLPVLLIFWTALVVKVPAPVGDWLQDEFLPVFANMAVWGGAAAVAVWILARIIHSFIKKG